MKRLLIGLVLALAGPASSAQIQDFEPVTKEMLLSPGPDDWLMYNRTYDNQRFSPLDQINRANVSNLRMEWSRGLRPGIQETIPIVYRGVMYVTNPRGVIQALDATNGDLIWEYRRRLPEDLDDYLRAIGRMRTIAIYQDMIYNTSPDGYLVALDARSGKLRWETRVNEYRKYQQHTSGAVVADGKVISGRGCSQLTGRCFVAAHDAQTGRELWRFYTTPAPGEPGGESWADVPVDSRIASPWGLPGAYDPARKLVYWGIANPKPHTRLKRHGDPEAVPLSTPSELYSNSTVALEVETGRLAWYYQHVPGDDWDSDHTQERVLLRIPLDPDPRTVRWISPRLGRGQEREIVVELGEPGGLWALDRDTGEFLWATPFPHDTPDFHVSHVDVETGTAHIDAGKLLRSEEDRHIVCYSNTKGYWPMSYHPGKNSLYIPYHDVCIERTGDLDSTNGHVRTAIPRPGSDPDAFTGIARVDMTTGRIHHLYTQRNPGNGAMLATAGDLLFWGDMNRRMRGFDVDTGQILWETIVGGIVQTSTITYAVDGRQYLAVLTGDGLSATGSPLTVVEELQTARGHNAIYVFALPR